MAEKVGPKTREQLDRMGRVWKQGEHVLISGSTGSGKTVLARHIDQLRTNRKGFVVAFIMKLKSDRSILEEYKGWTRWKTWKKRPPPNQRQILLWPDTSKLNPRDALDLQKSVFGHAVDELFKSGHWTVHIDEGLYMADPRYLNMAQEMAMLHQIGRSGNLTIVTLTQRPSHLPLVIYSSASHAFVGRARESSDVKRLAELGGKENAKSLGARIESQGRHDFLWIPAASDWEPERVNLRE